MNVVLGAEPLIGARTGVGHYTWQLYQGLSERPEVAELVPILHHARYRPAPVGQSGEVAERPRASFGARVGLALRRGVGGLPGVARALSWVRIKQLRKSLRGLTGETLYHEPNFVLRPLDMPSVVTVHDLSWYHHAHYHPAARVRRMREGVPASLQRAGQIITVSHFVKQELLDVYGVEASRVSVTHLGVDGRFRPRAEGALCEPLRRLGLVPGEYILSVATLEPRKNLHAVLSGFEALPPALQRRYPLVMAGAYGWKSGPLERRIERLRRRGLLHYLGYVSDADLPLLFGGAACFVFPSVYEGFGLPPLEAMASGVPVLTSKGTVMEEVAGGAALLVEPRDQTAFDEALRRLLEDHVLREDLAARGLARARHFTWQSTLSATMQAYRLALSR